jgi:hypothetical protein
MSLNPSHIASFCAEHYGVPLCPLHGAVNIVYIEGMSQDGTLNADIPNHWNDLRLLLTFNEATGWKIVHNAIATTEPGEYYTKNPTNKNGCARIAFGYHPPAWARGLHKGVQPALKQVKQVRIHRDLNMDGLRNRFEPPFWSEIITDKKGNIFHIGLNDHTTNKKFRGDLIGKFSAGCTVGKLYAEHMVFLGLTEKDIRIKPGETYLYDKWVLPGDLYTKIKSTWQN